MYSRPFASFTPSSDDIVKADASLRLVLRVVKRCIARGELHGDPIDAAHVLLSLVQGLVAQESAGLAGQNPSFTQPTMGPRPHHVLRRHLNTQPFNECGRSFPFLL